MIIVADGSALYAAFDDSHPYTKKASDLMATEGFVLSPLVITELDYLVRRGLGFGATLKA